MSTLKIRKNAPFDFVRYGSVWEDADILCEGLSTVTPGGRVLSVCSGGDNVLSLLTLDPKEVVAVDINTAQLACLELRVEAFRTLDYEKLLAFLGVLPMSHRQEIYYSLRNSLSSGARSFWDENPEKITKGIIHVGKFERYLRSFGCYVLPCLFSKALRRELLSEKSVEERLRFYDVVWDGFLWRSLFRIFFSRKMMGFFGRDPSFFHQVRGGVAVRILERTRHALTHLPTHNNPYLAYIVTGNYRMNALPRYLRPEFYDVIRRRIDRIQLFHGTVEEGLSGVFDGYNLSDVFEYMDLQEVADCYGDILRHARKGSRIVYWNMLVDHGIPETLRDRVKPLLELSETLHHADKAWFYQRLHVDEVL